MWGHRLSFEKDIWRFVLLRDIDVKFEFISDCLCDSMIPQWISRTIWIMYLFITYRRFSHCYRFFSRIQYIHANAVIYTTYTHLEWEGEKANTHQALSTMPFTILAHFDIFFFCFCFVISLTECVCRTQYKSANIYGKWMVTRKRSGIKSQL